MTPMPLAARRTIERRLPSKQHGPIARLISPDELGEELKPFIFLDYFNAEIEPGFGFGMHPHSGIATLTWQPGTDVRYRDTTGKDGILKAGGIEWMNAGGGAWHEAALLGSGKVTGFQLWVPLPPDVENGPALGQYVAPEEVPELRFHDAIVKVLLGSMDGSGGQISSPILSHHDMNYLAVTIEPGRRWQYVPPSSHNVAWAFPYVGSPLIQGQRAHAQMVIFGREGYIEVEARTDVAQLILGTARHYQEPLVIGTSSVHSGKRALELGLARIKELGESLNR